MGTVEQYSGRLFNTAVQLAQSRWPAIQAFFGSTLRNPATLPPRSAVREPHAPGQRPVPGSELFASTCVEIDVGKFHGVDHDTGAELLIAEATRMLDTAVFRLEQQVREQMRGKPARRGADGESTTTAIPPAITVGPGDAISVQPLAGCPEGMPIRVRAALLPPPEDEPTRKVVRFDLELLLVRTSMMDCIRGASSNLVIDTAPRVRAAITQASRGNHQCRVLFDYGDVGGEPVCIVVGVGAEFGARVRDFGHQLVGEAQEQGEQGDGAG